MINLLVWILYLFFGITVQTRGLVILTTEGRKDLSFIETLALRHRMRRVERFTVDRSFPAFAGTAVLLPRNGGVSVGTNLAIAQGDHKDRPYPRFLLYQERKAAWGSQDDNRSFRTGTY